MADSPLTSTSTTTGTRIGLRVSNQRAYVWDVNDIATLRAEHHICGVLAGTLPHLAQQNVFLGLPLVLLPEEVVLLVEKEIAVLVDDASAHLPPTDLQLIAHAEAEKVEMARQGALSEARIAAESRTQANSEAAQRKRAEREAKKAAKVAAVASEGDVASLLVTSDTPENPKLARTDTPTSTSAGYTTPYTVQIPASSSSLPWYSTPNLPANNSTIYDSLETARAAGVWTYPTTDASRARCAVFRDLWEKDYFMGGGIKFGGDYLVYPGDPLRYHSHFVAQTLRDHEPLRPMEIVAHGRLGTATKKSHLLCTVRDDREHAGEVEYFSVQWAGFG